MSGSLSLERGLAVMQLMKDHGALGVRDVARRLDLSPAAIQRLMNTLASHGYAEQDQQTRHYRLGTAVLGLAYAAQDQNRLIDHAKLELSNLAADHGFNGFVGARRGAAAVYLMCVQGPGPIIIRATPGDTMRLHTTALGKALLCSMSDAEIASLLGEGPYEQVTPRSITELNKLLAQIRNARSVGYTSSLNEGVMGVYSYGAPLFGPSGALIAAISVAVPREAYPQTKIAEIGFLVKSAAGRISAKLGFEPTR